MATKAEIREHFAKYGKQGGKTRARNMTPEQRAESARKASEARWKKSMARIDASLARIKKLQEGYKERDQSMRKEARKLMLLSAKLERSARANARKREGHDGRLRKS